MAGQKYPVLLPQAWLETDLTSWQKYGRFGHLGGNAKTTDITASILERLLPSLLDSYIQKTQCNSNYRLFGLKLPFICSRVWDQLSNYHSLSLLYLPTLGCEQKGLHNDVEGKIKQKVQKVIRSHHLKLTSQKIFSGASTERESLWSEAFIFRSTFKKNRDEMMQDHCLQRGGERISKSRTR